MDETPVRTGGPRDMIAPLFEDLKKSYLDPKWQDVTTTLRTIQNDLRGCGILTGDVQAEMTEVGKQVTALTREHESVRQQLHALSARRPLWHILGVGAAAGVLLGGVLTGAAWWLQPAQTSQEAALLRQLHGSIAQHYKALPKGMQEQVTMMYERAGYQPPRGQ